MTFCDRCGAEVTGNPREFLLHRIELPPGDFCRRCCVDFDRRLEKIQSMLELGAWRAKERLKHRWRGEKPEPGLVPEMDLFAKIAHRLFRSL